MRCERERARAREPELSVNGAGRFGRTEGTPCAHTTQGRGRPQQQGAQRRASHVGRVTRREAVTRRGEGVRECVCVSARTEGGGAGRRPPPSARSRPPSRRAPPVPRAPPRPAPTLRPTRNARRRPPASPPAGPPRSAPTARRTPRSRSACKAARRGIIDTEHRHSATGVQQQQSEERSPKRNAWECQHALRRAELSLAQHTLRTHHYN